MTQAAPVQLPTSAPVARGWRARVRAAWSVTRFAATRAWRWAKPYLQVISAVGWLVLLGAVLFLAAGVTLGWPEFVFVGITFLAGLVVAVPFVFGRAAFAVGVELEPRRVVAGERALGRMAVTNTGARKSTPSRMELPVGKGLAEFIIPGLDPQAEHEELFAVPTNRRAVIVAGPAVSVRGDQLGLLRRAVKWSDPTELFVHPRTARLDPSAAGLVRDLEGEITKTITNSDISFHALRAYEPGDDRRYVHWRTSARTGQLMVRQFEETRRSQLTIVQTSDRRYYTSDEEFELAVSVMASIAVQVVREGTRVSVVTEGMSLRTHTPTAVLDDSCRLEQLTSPFANMRDFARISTLTLPPPSVAMVIAGSKSDTTDFRAVESLFGSDSQTFGFRIELGAPARVSRVSGFSVMTIGELADLPRVLRRVR
ncbi:uncharacterized protein DUF58 [Diaminobutyricimonas aerilata]|uniref:Uncharacterized protein DUF58 n=1 Tax=Diaminobutyricimonas aerilata TaxID=1162967 RepID=A0A2M9CIC2_9MICO|nr:DUF58 domain-containing protein [Diaminobutyricimonas aerilata]PJJ71676.1 uncharacterized protein DUF58 [Diaminobutyricimonas aerilata]